MNKVRKGITEVKIRLLPEKSKRDYILRLVSSIIVLIFLIINIVFVYIPYNRYTNQLNNVRNENSVKESELSWKKDKYDYISHDIYYYNDETITDILNSTLNFEKILKLFNDLETNVTYRDIHDNLSFNDILNPEYNQEIRPFGSRVEYIIYSEKKSTITVSLEFLSINDAIYYEDMLKKIQYVIDVESGNISPVLESNKYKRIYTITLDNEHPTCPKVAKYKWKIVIY